MAKKDFLDEIIEESTKKNPRFPEMVDAAYRRRVLLRELAAKRERAGITQKDVATRMRTSQSAVARIERGEIDAKLSTVERYAAAIGHRLEWRVKKV
ncbi:MAG: helix-turn-helix domain-containing protein [Actinomycetota bacterium]